MNTIKKTLLGTVIVGLTVLGVAKAANAIWCPFVTDPKRTSLFGSQATDRTAIAGAKKSIVEQKKKELELWEKRKTFKEEDFPKSSYYEYMKNAAATGSESLIPAQTDGSGVDASGQEDYIRRNMFYDSDDSKVSQEDQQKVKNARMSYLEALAQETLSLSAGARESIATELNALKEAKTTAGGVIQQIDLLVQNKKFMIKQKAADILLQAKLLELEAAQLLLGLSHQCTENPNGTSGKICGKKESE